MKNKPRIGIIGAGAIAREHLKVMRAFDGIEAIGIASRTKIKAEVLAREYQLDVYSDDIKFLMKELKPDALMLCVSADQMCAVAASVMPFKLPLFLEKPAGMTPEENLKLVNLALEFAVATMVGYNRRYYSIFQKGMNIIRDHGPLLGIMVEGHERMWRVREGGHFPSEVMDNWIFCNATHTVDLLRFFGGELKTIRSIARRFKEKSADQLAAVMEFNNGTIGHYQAHWYSPGGWRVVLYGDGVSVEFKPLETGRWMDKNLNSFDIFPDDVDVRYKPGFYRQMEAFVQLVREGIQEQRALDVEGAYKTMLLARQILLS